MNLATQSVDMLNFKKRQDLDHPRIIPSHPQQQIREMQSPLSVQEWSHRFVCIYVGVSRALDFFVLEP